MSSRGNTRKGFMDGADLRGLLSQFPELKSSEGQVTDALRTAAAPEAAIQAWHDLVAQEIVDDEDAGY